MTRGRRVRLLLIALAVLLGLSLFWRSEREPEIEAGSTLVVELSGQYVEATKAPLLGLVMGERRQPFVSVLSRLAMAERDDRIDTVVLRISRLQIGWGKIQDLRDAIGRLRAAGRRVIAHLELGGLVASREYYLATAAEEIHLEPGSSIPLVGLAAEYVHLGGVWEKLGIDIEVARVGKYKSAVEAIAGKGMSEASREMANSLLDSVYQQFVAGIAEGRGLSESQVLAAIDTGPTLPAELLSLGLIDGITNFYELTEAQPGKTVWQSDYAKVSAESVGFDPVAQVALIYGSGNVVSGKASVTPGSGTVFASRSASDALMDAAKDDSIDAIILRIDSPGGSSVASEEIWQAVKRAREVGSKPIVASFSDVAASGGYYVATAADAIVAAPATLTGSIGVFLLRPVFGGLFDKLDINVESLTRGKHADFNLSAQPLSEGTRQRLQSLAVDTYALFTERVSEGRSLDIASVEQVAQGRVWTGQQALENGLVDELGGLHTAVVLVQEKLGLDEEADVALVPFPAAPSLSDQIASLLQGRSVSLAAVLAESGFGSASQLVGSLEAWTAELPVDVPLLIPPLLVEIR